MSLFDDFDQAPPASPNQSFGANDFGNAFPSPSSDLSPGQSPMIPPNFGVSPSQSPQMNNFGQDDLSALGTPSGSGFLTPQTGTPTMSPNTVARGMNSEEDSPAFKAWKEKHKVEVEKRKAEGEARQKKALVDGSEVLKKLYNDRSKQIAQNKAENKQAEEEQKSLSKAAGETTDSLWLNVSKLVDLTAESRTEKDTARLREILISLKQ